MPCERCFKKIHPGVFLHPGANLPLLSRWSKLKLHLGAFLHPGVFCAHERKKLIAICILYGSFIAGQHFFDPVLKETST